MRFLLLLALVGAAAAVNPCPAAAIYNQDLNKCYVFGTLPRQYLLAEQDCMSRGGHLTSVGSGFENVVIQENAASIFANSNSSDFWLGGSNLKTGTWAWADGASWGYTKWAAGQPDSSAGSCASAMVAGGSWRVQMCQSAKPYICETTPVSPTCPSVTCPAPTPCPVTPAAAHCDSTWTYFAPTDSCYKRFFEARWSDAEASCVSQSAHLASVHSDAEETFVCNLSASGKKEYSAGQVWIGMYYKNGQWVWSDGSKTDYYKWAPKQPDNMNKEFCVEVYADGDGRGGDYEGWNNWQCQNTARAYVCKKAAYH